MRSASFVIGALIISIASAQSLSKKQEQVPKAILISHYIYVEAWDGDFFNPHLLSDDRKAIVDVQDALRVWNRYAITVKRRDAELLFVVRKGRIVSVNGNVGGNVGNGPTESGPHDERGSTQPKAEGGIKVGVGAELGSPDDLFLRLRRQPGWIAVGTNLEASPEGRTPHSGHSASQAIQRVHISCLEGASPEIADALIYSKGRLALRIPIYVLRKMLVNS